MDRSQGRSAQTPVERLLFSWKGPFCTSLLVGGRVSAQLHSRGSMASFFQESRKVHSNPTPGLVVTWLTLEWKGGKHLNSSS